MKAKKILVIILLVICCNGCTLENEEVILLKEKNSELERINKKLEIENKELSTNLKEFKLNEIKGNESRFELYRETEIHDDKIYALTINTENNKVIRELWRYDTQGRAKMMFKGKGVGYKVNNDNSRIAINDGGIYFLDEEGNTIKRFSREDIKKDIKHEEYIALLGWSDDGRYLWLSVGWTTDVTDFIQINADTWEVIRFYGDETKDISINNTLNCNNGWIAYTNYPVLFDDGCVEEFKQSNMTIFLKIYNFFSKETIIIDEVELNKFNPKWAGDDALRYDINGLPVFYDINSEGE